jgi:hypothetical protein
MAELSEDDVPRPAGQEGRRAPVPIQESPLTDPPVPIDPADAPGPAVAPTSNDATSSPVGHPDGAADKDPDPEYPAPRSLSVDAEELEWDEKKPLAENFREAGRKLRRCEDLYRGGYADGLIPASRHPNVPPTTVKDPALLASIIADRLKVRRTKDDKLKGSTVPSSQLAIMLTAESFLQQFPPVDRVTAVPLHLAPDFAPCSPGYNDGGPGQRILYIGGDPWCKPTHERIDAFLDAMNFATEADRTNALAAALTVQLHNHWPGGKPILAVTADKSHSGKDTVLDFASGMHPHVSISYQKPDWPVERAIAGAISHDRGLVLIILENAKHLDSVPL